MKAFCALFALAHVSCAGYAADVIVDAVESTFQETKYQCILRASDLKNAPRWDSEKDPPPLRAKKAASLALADVEARVGNHPLWPDSPGWMLHTVALVQGYAADVWYYKISVTPKAPGSNSFPPVTLFVTLDGKVVPLAERK